MFIAKEPIRRPSSVGAQCFADAHDTERLTFRSCGARSHFRISRL